MNEKQMFERFQKVVLAAMCAGKFYDLTLSPLELATLHGALALVLKHPQVTQDSETGKILSELRKRLLLGFRDMGFTEEETQYLDTKDKE